ncbi:hypothetical protein CA54_15200 [Symmachiella macrocystis]|uniref:Prepilin-type N-terminal cleavage/methylation domain-containing protein n=1 Tax=Symmachiella macrocystis TaxID=2527985 RepID=A0A5C6BL40_9PLAN|nr:type II secretion system protein [Symmachiella macrocystis]TWU12695.1 hypothetical protein CA54_15200 [Symmachiella macrocystis]
MNRRRGISLIEMIVVIGASSIILLVGAGMLHTLMRSERVATESLVHATNHARLAAQFRDDIHAATTVSIQGEPGADDVLQITNPNAAEILYSQQGRLLVRRETEATHPPRHEQFRLPVDVRIRFAINDSGPHKIADLSWNFVDDDSMTSAERATRPPLNPLKIEAIIGKDHRFQEATP